MDPDYRRQGIGTALHKYQIELAKQIDKGIVRYATGRNNVGSHKVAAANGFRQAASFLWMQAQADPAPSSAPQSKTLADKEWPVLQAALSQASFAPLAGGLYSHNWKWKNLGAERLRAHLLAGEIWAARQAEGLTAWAIVSLPDWSEHVQIYSIEGNMDALSHLARDLRGYAAQAGKKGVETAAFEDAQLIGALEAAGYTSPESFSMHVFEKSMS